MLDGIEVMHNNSIYHRDIKLENILYDANSKLLKFADFGLAEQNKISTTTNVKDGTLAYLAPDSFGGRRYRDRMDIYALGICLYAIVCGYLPFSEPSYSCSTYKKFKKEGVDSLPFNRNNVTLSS